MRRIPLVANFVMAILLMPFLGCSSSPSSSAGEEFAREQIKKQSQDRIKLISFSKTNGKESAPNGVPSYELEYEAEIEFLENCRWGTKSDFDGRWNGDYRCIPIIEGPGYSGELFAPFGEGKKGSRTKVKNYVMFQKTEQGWQPVERPGPPF